MCHDITLQWGEWCQTTRADLFLKSFQGLKLQASQLDMDVFGDIWDEEGQDELEGQQPVLETQQQQQAPLLQQVAAKGWDARPPLESPRIG